MVIAAQWATLSKFLTTDSETPIDADKATWEAYKGKATAGLTDPDLMAMKASGMLFGCMVKGGELIYLPPDYIVWEKTISPCHGLRFSFACDLCQVAQDGLQKLLAAYTAGSKDSKSPPKDCELLVAQQQAMEAIKKK